MPADQTNQQYDEALPQQRRCRHCFDGQDAVKAARDLYLPLLSGHTSTSDPDYQDYLERSLLYGAFSRTVWGLLGSLFRRPWSIEGAEGEAWAEILDDATLTTMTLDQFEVHIAEHILVEGRYGLLAGWSDQAQRPYISGFEAAQIRDWHFEIVDGQRRLRWIILSEEITEHVPTDDDPFNKETKTRYWVPQLDADGLYEIKAYEEQSQGEGTQRRTEFVEVSARGPIEEGERLSAQPTVGDERLTEIPWVFVNPYSDEPDIEQPPLLALADTVLDHYRIDADLKNALHVLGVPTPYMFGADLGGAFDQVQDQFDDNGNLIEQRRRDQDEEAIPLGSSSAIIGTNPQAKVGFLQLQDSLQSLFDEKKNDETRMAALGGRLLEEQSNQAEAARAIELRQSGEQSALAAIGTNIAACLTTALGYAAQFLTGQEEPRVEANNDFYGNVLEPQEIAALVSAWKEGAISDATLYYNLNRGEVLRPGQTIEEYQEELEAQRATATNGRVEEERVAEATE